MYNRYYNLREDPFRLTPDSNFLYMTARHREALSGLIYSAFHRTGLTVLMGEAGTGKTMLLHVLKGWLEKRQFIVAMCNNPKLTRDEFFDLLLAQLGVACPSSLKSRQLITLEETLMRRLAEGRRSTVIVDEAHGLPAELLEEIRLLQNLETSREKLLDVIISGQPELADMLRRPELRQFKQRVSCFCRLGALQLEEVREYIQHRLTHAGLPQQQVLFPADTIELIHEYSRGIPRLINTLCDNALQTGFALQAPRITATIIREAAKDLDLLSEDDVISALVASTEPLAMRRAAPAVSTQGPVTPQFVNGQATAVEGSDEKIPLESYTSRQKSLGFLTGLMDRWK